MNFCYSLIITFFGIAGSTSASEAFEDNLASIRAEVKAYCLSPAEYENSEGGRKYGPIKDWDVSALTTMKGLFSPTSLGGVTCPSCDTCNPPVSNWNVGEVIDFKRMFDQAATFDQDISKWNVANGQSFAAMFRGADTFNQDLSKWKVGNGRRFNGMFYEAAAFNQRLSSWKVGNSRTFKSMFYRAATFNQDLSKWDVGNGQNFANMFMYSGMNHFIGDWHFKSAKNCAGNLSVFSSMVGVMKHHYISYDEWWQLNNFVTLVNCATK